MTLHLAALHLIMHISGKQMGNKMLLWWITLKKYQLCRRKEMNMQWIQQYKTDYIRCLAQGKGRVAEYIWNRQLAEMEVFVFFIYKMTLLVRIVGGSKLSPYDSNWSKSLCVWVFVHDRVCGLQRCCAWADIRQSYTAYGRELRRGG